MNAAFMASTNAFYDKHAAQLICVNDDIHVYMIILVIIYNHLLREVSKSFKCLMNWEMFPSSGIPLSFAVSFVLLCTVIDVICQTASSVHTSCLEDCK